MSAAKKKVSGMFPIVAKGQKGYDQQQVESFLDEVKKVFESKNTDTVAQISSADLRHKSFKLKRNGYNPRFVDAALDRLEDLFFERERRALIQQLGMEEWTRNVNKLLQEITGRLNRPVKKRFKKPSFFAHGYKISQVDAALNQIAQLLQANEYVKPSQIRQIRFHAQRGGYDEAQVDAFLDAVVVYFLSIKE